MSSRGVVKRGYHEPLWLDDLSFDTPLDKPYGGEARVDTGGAPRSAESSIVGFHTTIFATLTNFRPNLANERPSHVEQAKSRSFVGFGRHCATFVQMWGFRNIEVSVALGGCRGGSGPGSSSFRHRVSREEGCQKRSRREGAALDDSS